MLLSDRIRVARPYIEAIGQHTDEDSSVRKAALEALKTICDAQIASIDAEVAARTEALRA